MAVARLPSDIIGLGLYSPSEAASYAGVSSQKFSRWVFGSGRNLPVIEPQLGRDGDRLVTFIDFAQTLTVHDVRTAIGIPLPKIREAYIRAREMYGVDRPFAMKHGAFAFGDFSTPEGKKRCEIAVFLKKAKSGPKNEREFKKAVEDSLGDRVVQLTGKQRGNLLMKQIVAPFSQRLIFDDEGMASEYVAYEGHGHRILIDPTIRFGQPYLEHIGFEARTLAEAARIEKSASRAAKHFRVQESAVCAAAEYIRSLKPQKPGRSAA